MKKFSLFIITLALLIFFAGADYLVNTPSTIDKAVLAQISAKDTINQIKTEQGHGSAEEDDANMIQIMLAEKPQEYAYNIGKRVRTYQLFESFDLRLVNNIRIYKDTLSGGESPIVIYEIHGPQNQGRLTYLNVKLKMLDQVDLTGSINETNEFGENSLFYNDDNAKNTGFLLAQVGDMLFGFQYSKENAKTFKVVRGMIETLQLLTINLNS